MAIKPERNTNYPYLNQSDQDALEDIASQDQDTDTRFKEEIAKCFDKFNNEQLETQASYYRQRLYRKALYKDLILRAYNIYFQCITIRQLPLSNPNRPSIAECKKEKDKLIKDAVEGYEKRIKEIDTEYAEEELKNYKRLYSCIKKAQGERPSA